ncbi:protein of unknown function [Methylorubrum extorquens]|uniref:CobN/magnesium chelatase domain-containing protein n=1 Tax=Methylorubrum extorquens TaxID=408 RepID=A0A2N9AV30_METEX|nr:protein of unknown function [Methylorubrum extorquens]
MALSGACWPALAVGALPVVYPFIVDDPGEAAPLKRRLGGIALGHLTPTIEAAGLTPPRLRRCANWSRNTPPRACSIRAGPG